MQQTIRDLDDTTALAVLNAFARARSQSAVYHETCPPELARALADTFELPPDPEPTPSEANLARLALLALAEDPDNHQLLTRLIEGDIPRSFDLGTSIAIAALIALQTRVKVEKKDGKWTILLHKTPMSSKYLIELVKGVLARAPLLAGSDNAEPE